MKKLQLFLSLSVLVALSISTNAQRNLVVSGKSCNGDGGSMSYSVGQVFYQNHIGTTGHIDEGFQQPIEIMEITSISESNKSNIEVRVYPTPTYSSIRIAIKETIDFSVQINYEIYDNWGKIVKAGPIQQNQLELSVEDLQSGIYYLKIQTNQIPSANALQRSFKIIKQ